MNRLLQYIACATLLVLVTACKNDEVKVRPTPEQGRLPGLFSIAENKQVYFSQGNLCYCPKLQNFRFAAHQYDVQGKSNESISNFYEGWIDLFGWGTGKYPASYGLIYMFYDKFWEWGNNPITNGGNVAEAWRTLSAGEWDYLLNSRPHAAILRGIHVIQYDDTLSMKAVILLPDLWKHPAGVSFSTDSTDFASSMSHDTVSLTEWVLMEKAGAVALPFGGNRIWGNRGEDRIGVAMVTAVGKEGSYWTATGGDDNRSAVMLLINDSLPSLDESSRPMGYSVRLVQDK